MAAQAHGEIYGADGDMDKGDGKGAEACGGTIFLFFLKQSSYPLGKGIIVPCLAVLSVFAKIIALCKNRLVYSVSRFLWDPFYKWLFSCPREKPENG